MSELVPLRLKGVVMCSFARSEKTNLNLYRQVAHYPGDLGVGEAFLFISKGGDQVVFMFGDITIEVDGVQRQVLDSRKLRLGSGSWDPLMLQNYANEVGLNLIGIKRFEQVYAERRKKA